LLYEPSVTSQHRWLRIKERDSSGHTWASKLPHHVMLVWKLNSYLEASAAE